MEHKRPNFLILQVLLFLFQRHLEETAIYKILNFQSMVRFLRHQYLHLENDNILF